MYNELLLRTLKWHFIMSTIEERNVEIKTFFFINLDMSGFLSTIQESRPEIETENNFEGFFRCRSGRGDREPVFLF